MTFRTALAAAAAVAATLAACSTAGPPPAGPIPTEPGEPPFPSLPPDVAVATSPAQIAGDWQSAGPGGSGMRVDIGQGRITASFGCLAKAWTYRFEGQRIVTTPDEIASCMRAESPFEAEMFNHVDRADTVYHRGGRGLVFRGSGSQLVLVPR